MKKLINRWNSPTPLFWQKMQKIGLMFASLGLVFITPPFGMALIGLCLISSGSFIIILSQFIK